MLVGALLDLYLQLAQCYYEAPTVSLALSPADQADFAMALQQAQRERVASLEGGLATLTTRLHEHVRKEQVEVYFRTKGLKGQARGGAYRDRGLRRCFGQPSLPPPSPRRCPRQP